MKYIDVTLCQADTIQINETRVLIMLLLALFPGSHLAVPNPRYQQLVVRLSLFLNHHSCTPRKQKLRKKDTLSSQ